MMRIRESKWGYQLGRVGRPVVLSLIGLVGVGAAGCAGSSAGGSRSRTAADENAPAPPDDATIAKLRAQQKAEPAKISASESADFNRVVQSWETAQKAGPLTAADCRAIAGKFSRVAKGGLTAQAHFNAGTVLGSCGLDKEAEPEYQAALAANAAYAPALNNLGEIYYRQGNVQTARQWFDKAIAADPTKIAAAYANLGLVIFENARNSGDASQYKEAISKLRRALAIDSDSMAAYSLLALIYYTTAENDKSKLQLAELVCKQANETNDKYAPIYNTLGLIQLRKKNVTGALKEFEKAVELDPKFVEAHLNIGAIGLSSRSYEKAALAFQAVLKQQPNNFDATIGMGVAARGQRRIDEAEGFYKKAAQLDAKSCAVSYNLGLLYQDYKSDATNSNLNQAKDFYRQFLSCGRAEKHKVADAERRIKDIDDTFVALEEAKKAEAEAKKMQEEMERQQKEMERQQQEQQKAAPAAETPSK